MHVHTFGIIRIAEHTCSDHILHNLHFGCINVVFGKHISLFIFFNRFAKPPQFIHADTCGHFAHNMFACFQGCNGLRHMALHGSGDDNRINIRFKHVFKYTVGLLYARFFGYIFEMPFVKITHGCNFHVFNGIKPHKSGHTARTCNTDFNLFHSVFSFFYSIISTLTALCPVSSSLRASGCENAAKTVNLSP